MSPADLLPMDGNFHVQVLYLHWQMYQCAFIGRTDVPGWALFMFFPVLGFVVWIGCTLQVAASLYCSPVFTLFGVPLASWFLVNYAVPKLETKLFGTRGLTMFATILTCGMIAFAGIKLIENRLVKAIRKANV